MLIPQPAWDGPPHHMSCKSSIVSPCAFVITNGTSANFKGGGTPIVPGAPRTVIVPVPTPQPAVKLGEETYPFASVKPAASRLPSNVPAGLCGPAAYHGSKAT